MIKKILTKPVVLIGMMGSGKSTVGKKLARKLNLQFYDSDKVLEEREALSIVDIHDFMGERYFYQKEEEVIKISFKKEKLMILNKLKKMNQK